MNSQGGPSKGRYVAADVVSQQVPGHLIDRRALELYYDAKARANAQNSTGWCIPASQNPSASGLKVSGNPNHSISSTYQISNPEIRAEYESMRVLVRSANGTFVETCAYVDKGNRDKHHQNWVHESFMKRLEIRYQRFREPQYVDRALVDVRFIAKVELSFSLLKYVPARREHEMSFTREATFSVFEGNRSIVDEILFGREFMRQLETGSCLTLPFRLDKPHSITPEQEAADKQIMAKRAEQAHKAEMIIAANRQQQAALNVQSTNTSTNTSTSSRHRR